MTKKRFYLDENGINDKEYEFSVLGEDELVEIINELHEENIEYKQELDNIYLLIGKGDWSGLIALLIDDEKSKTK